MVKVTWDSGVFYRYEDREDPEKVSPDVRDALEGMVALHEAGQIELQLAASSASELQRKGADTGAGQDWGAGTGEAPGEGEATEGDEEGQEDLDPDEARYLVNFEVFRARVAATGLLALGV